MPKDSLLKIYARRFKKTLNHALIETFILYPFCDKIILNPKSSDKDGFLK
jgi:hypothetical protein